MDETGAYYTEWSEPERKTAIQWKDIETTTKNKDSEVKWSRSVVSNSLRPHELYPIRLCHPWDFPGKSAGVDCHFLLQGIFPTQESNPGLPHWRQTLYRLSHQGSPESVMTQIIRAFHVSWPSIFLLWRNVSLGLLSIFWLGCLFFWYWPAELFVYFGN